MVIKNEKTIKTEHVRSVMKIMHQLLTSIKPDRLTAVCALIELAIYTLNDKEPLKRDLLKVYKKHVTESEIILPDNRLAL